VLSATPTNNTETPEQKLKCGIVMPISEIDGLSEKHWVEVFNILSNAVDIAGFTAEMVSSTDEVGIIQQTIIHNLYDNPIVVCDVSAKNPNVMFELGMRLAFDKPTVIVKDDKTPYSFDTSVIQHLSYPRDLHYHQIVDFTSKLAAKIRNTYKRAETDPQYTTFLKHFGEFKVAKIDQTEVSAQDYIIEELKGLRGSVQRLEQQTRARSGRPQIKNVAEFEIRQHLTDAERKLLFNFLAKSHPDTRTDIRDDTLLVFTGKPLTPGEKIVIESVLSHLPSLDETRSHDGVETEPSET
jgi:hypothetical protein